MKQCFVVGVGRSGTTLVSAFIGAHPKVEPFAETAVLRRYIFSKAKNPKENALKDEKLARNPELLEKLRNHSDIKTAYLQVMCEAKLDVIYKLDKDPRLIEFIPQTATLFPEAKFVHVLRDPRDVLASKLKAEWSRDRSLFSYLVASRVQLKSARNAENKLRGRVFVLRYEDFLSHPEQQCKNLCKFLEIQYDDSMLDHLSAARTLVDESEVQWKGNVHKPLMKNNTGNWKPTLSNLQHTAALSVVKDLGFCFDSADSDGYSPFTQAQVKLLCIGVKIVSSIYLKVQKLK